MKCVHCGANIPDGQLICPRCNAEVQMVPDYNPLDDVLAREVKGSVEGNRPAGCVERLEISEKIHQNTAGFSR